MYRGFNLELKWYNEDNYKKGLKLFEIHQQQVKETLDKFLLEDGSLNGSLMQSDWFPQIDADIFISHSHNDRKKAISLAFWLHQNFGLTTFIDSSIWGYCNDLLRDIDNTYCLQSNGNYSYTKRNFSTSHVHMMLSTALMMMIDKTECLFFLNTPSSITTDDAINQTESPWIYSEIAITQLIRKKSLKEYRPDIIKSFSVGGRIAESLRIKYDLYLDHLTDINDSDLAAWQSEVSKISPRSKYPLDKLYELNIKTKVL